MIYRIRHLTRYTYEHPVLLGPQTIRLMPRGDPFQRLRAFKLDFVPQPVGTSRVLDAEGNSVVRAWFSDATSRLYLAAEMEVETLLTDPFNFLLEDDALTLPFDYRAVGGAVGEDASRWLQRGIGLPGPVSDFAHEAARDAGHETVGTLAGLCRRIHERCAALPRRDGPPHPADRTLRDRHGSCRDLTTLFMECCATLGIAARFVSGYCEGLSTGDIPELHAWAEVLLPGAGWRGFDPSLGLAVSDRHIALAAARNPAAAAPLAGSFLGGAAPSRLEYEIGIVRVDAP